jgi:spermidine/putrescine-binding protein
MAVKGGPAGKALAMKFINFFLQPEQINPYSFGVGSSSPLKDAPPPPPDQVPVPITNEEMSKAFVADAATAELINAHLDNWRERFEREVVPLIGN